MENSLFGSGGGSGGSIQILAKHLDGNGNLSVSGGDGTLGGGGGSGGRIVMHFLGNYLSDFQSQHTINWLGNLDIEGGKSGDQQSSSNGTEWHPQCLAGFSGSFCSACPVGTYKYGYSYGRCLPCENKPAKNSYYSERGVKTAYCPY